MQVFANACELRQNVSGAVISSPNQAMPNPAHRGRVFRFGVFEAFADSRELFRQGRRVRLQDQPFQLLLLLLESPGEIVDREFLRDHLWPENTFVDFSRQSGAGQSGLHPRHLHHLP
ncbi:MAG TPA: winged helix-turn-helix domain-containing protein [Edaphobacter sp.]|nr:winged helix-turn-helix domain-containing protein [Edaphobacter sp.]